MANICEPVIKIVMGRRAKVVVPRIPSGNEAPAKRQCRSERGLNAAASWTSNLPVDSRCLTSHILQLRNVETPYISRQRLGAFGWTRREAGRPVCGLEMSEEAKAVL